MSQQALVTEREVMIDWIASTQRMSLPDATMLSDMTLCVLVHNAFPGGITQFEEHTRELRDYPEAPGEHYSFLLDTTGW